MTCVPCKLASALARYGLNLLILGDVAINTLIGGSPHETVSSSLGRALQAAAVAGRPPPRFIVGFCRVLGFVFRNPNHCIDAILPEDNIDTIVKL
jgi:hypothetical protein